MPEISNPAVPPDSLVLVTGVNGFLGSHISDQFLQHGYKVRGTVRNLEKCEWLIKYFETKYGAGRFELVKVSDMAAEGAFHEAIREYYIHVQDTARLHVAAAILSEVKDERIFAYAGRFNWDKVLALLRQAVPGKVFPDDFSGGDDPHDIQGRERAEDLLRVLGCPGWTSLEKAILENIEDL
ncbi:hypothetical protein ACHAPT_008793 [Fusarium lateritium]